MFFVLLFCLIFLFMFSSSLCIQEDGKFGYFDEG